METTCPELEIAFLKPRWKCVCRIEHGTNLTKGKSGRSGRILEAARGVVEQFGCYSWSANGAVMYCGSYSEYDAKHFKSNLEGRIYQYLTNHKRDGAGLPKNTNAEVFDHINRALSECEVILQVFLFERCRLGSELVDFSSYATDPFLARAVEKLLICVYRRHGQCTWNKE